MADLIGEVKIEGLDELRDLVERLEAALPKAKPVEYPIRSDSVVVVMKVLTDSPSPVDVLRDALNESAWRHGYRTSELGTGPAMTRSIGVTLAETALHQAIDSLRTEAPDDPAAG